MRIYGDLLPQSQNAPRGEANKSETEELDGTETSYLVPLEAGQRGPTMGLTVGLTVRHVGGDH